MSETEHQESNGTAGEVPEIELIIKVSASYIKTMKINTGANVKQQNKTSPPVSGATNSDK